MSPMPDTAAAAEANVEQARAELAATLELLRDNLRPAHLVHEVMARPRNTVANWLAAYGHFARHSPLSGVIIGAAALALSTSMFRVTPGASQGAKARARRG